MFIEELYKIKREITQGMKHSFIAQTEAYQLNRDEWMDQLDTAEKRRNLKDLETPYSPRVPFVGSARTKVKFSPRHLYVLQ